MKLVLIPPGDFFDGQHAGADRACRKMAQAANTDRPDMLFALLKEETPQHRVTLTKPNW